MMKEVGIREAQMVFVNLQSRWEVPANRDLMLMREREHAENRLIALFMNEWGERGGNRRMMAVAYASYRRALYHARRN
jgi:hypothetical protein